MFDIFIKPSTIHLDCFTNCAAADEYASIDYASNFYPEWWKKLPKESYGHKPFPNIPQSTMKTCAGFMELYQNALIMPMWTDTVFTITDTTYDVTFATPWLSESHPYFQREGFLKNFHHVKIASPWLIKCKQEIYFSFQKPMYNFENPLDFVFYDGVIEFKYQHSTNINLGFKKVNKTTKINFRDPVVLLTPHTEKRIKFKTHYIDNNEEFHKLGERRASATTFINKYATNKRITKEKENQKKCPFHF